jgi:hypothetical protein
MYHLQISSKESHIKYNDELIPLLSFIHRLTWSFVRKISGDSLIYAIHEHENTEEPPIRIETFDKHYHSTNNDETYKFMMFLLDNLKNNSYLQKPEYKECIGIIGKLKDAYAISSDYRYYSRGNIVSYDLDKSSRGLYVKYQNGDFDRHTFEELSRDVLNDNVEVDGRGNIEFSDRTIDLIKLIHDVDKYVKSGVKIETFELDTKDNTKIKSTMSNGEVRIDTLKIFIILISQEKVYSRMFPMFHSEEPLLQKLRNGKYTLHRKIIPVHEPFKIKLNSITHKTVQPFSGYRFSSHKQAETMVQEYLYSLYKEHVRRMKTIELNSYYEPYKPVETTTKDVERDIHRISETDNENTVILEDKYVVFTLEEVQRQKTPSEYIYNKYISASKST